MPYSSGFSNPFGFVVTPWVKRLIIANGVMFVVTLGLPFLVPYLAFSPTLVFPRLWTIVTYMFVHDGIFHMLFNMLALFFFGPPLEERWGSRGFLKFYLLAGMGGAALSFLFLSYSIVGASAAVYGVMVAFAMYWPDNPIYIWGIFPVKAKWLVGALVALSLLYSLGGSRSGVAHLAHLGGAITAFVYLKSAWAPSQWGEVPQSRSRRRRSRQWSDIFANLVKPGTRSEEESAAPSPPVSTVGRKREVHRSSDEVDRILDKISRGGIASLTEEEKQRLEEASRRFRAN